jgi:hypothetical protein
MKSNLVLLAGKITDAMTGVNVTIPVFITSVMSSQSYAKKHGIDSYILVRSDWIEIYSAKKIGDSIQYRVPFTIKLTTQSWICKDNLSKMKSYRFKSEDELLKFLMINIKSL